MPDISVIIPVHNGEKYLRECLDSVISQTLKDIEIIIIDDGSTDESLWICEEYAKRDSRIKLIRQNNKGAGEARNNGLRNASGEFAAFLDCDDYYPSVDILETLYKKALEHNVKVCGGSFAELYGNEIKTEFTGSLSGYTFDNEGLVDYKDYQFDFGYHRFIYNLNFLKDNSLYFPDYRRFQDPPFFVKYMIAAESFYEVPMITYLLRIGHKKLLWTNQQQNGLLDAIKDNLETAKKNKLADLYVLTLQRLNEHSYVFNPAVNKCSLKTYIKLARLIYSADEIYVKGINENFKINKQLYPLRVIINHIFSLKRVDDYRVLIIAGIKFKFKEKKVIKCQRYQ